MGQLDHFDSGNTITPENDDTCEVSVVPPACPTWCLQLPPPHPTPELLAAVLDWEMFILDCPLG